MKAELLKKIDELENDFRSDYTLKENGYNEALEDVRQVIEMLLQSEWISVEKYDEMHTTNKLIVKL
jgi:hypothetical protein